MNEKVNGVTLRAVNYKESDKILTVFTLEKGKITVNARGVRKANAKMKQIVEPFCFAESMLAEKSGRFTVTEINSFDAFYPIRCDVVKYYVGMTALELTDFLLPDGLESPAHFVILVEFLKKLAYKSINPRNLLVKFFYDCALESGYSVNLSACGRCGEEITDKVFLSVKDGFCVCENCRKQGEGSFSIDTYRYLKKVANGDLLEESKELATNGLKFFGYYFSKTTGINLKSLSVLTDLEGV
ncbi:MAG: DNA repair protein RecO [Clostridiales bacterium]|nr:DNA repair protein RecO [Clostridiales bacterium]